MDDDFWVKITENPVAHICTVRVHRVKDATYIVSVCSSVKDAPSAMLCHLVIIVNFVGLQSLAHTMYSIY